MLTSRIEGGPALARPTSQPFRQPSQPPARQTATTTGTTRPRMALSYQRRGAKTYTMADGGHPRPMSEDRHARPSGRTQEPLYDLTIPTPTHAERARTLV